MRVLQLISYYNDNFYHDMMKEMISAGIDVRVCFPRKKGSDISADMEEFVDTFEAFDSADRFLFSLKERKILTRIISLYKSDGFSIIHAHTLFSDGYLAYRLNKIFGIPYIVAIRAADVNVFFKYRLNLRKIGRDILKGAERVIFISENYRNKVLNNYVNGADRIALNKKSMVIPNGIDKFFLSNPYDRNRRSVQSAKLLTVGFIYPRKNQLTVAKSINVKNIENYTVIGKILKKSYADKIFNIPNVNHKNFMNKSELIKEYRNSDIYVMPSIHETFGLTYIEAMTQGLPVIYSKGQGIDGFFNNGEIGFAVNPKSITDIQEKVGWIINDYDRMAKNCVDRAKQFSWKNVINEYKLIYNQLSEGR